MQIRKLAYLATATLTASLVLGACASEQKKAPAPPPVEKPVEKPAEKPKPALKSVKADIKTAEHAGAKGDRQPKMKLTGMAPEGWKIEIKKEFKETDIQLSAWANPPEGATEKPADAEFTKVFAFDQLEAGKTWVVHVKNLKGKEIKRQEFKY